MIGHHSLDSTTPRPVSVASTNEQGITTAMRAKIYFKGSSYDDIDLPVGITATSSQISSGSYVVALVPKVIGNGKCH